MTLDQMRYYKQQKGYSLNQLSALSGVPRGTLQKIFSGETKSPRHDTLKALEDVLKPDSAHTTVAYDIPKHDFAHEPAPIYKANKLGYHTLDDYYALPEDRRVELINGMIYDMSAPTPTHQMICLELCMQLKEYIRQKNGHCIPLISPIDVQLDCDDYTMVQPDILVLCDRKKLNKRCIMGAPDFIIEVLSPATSRKDSLIKSHKYEAAGVREYWMVDPLKERVIAYFFEEDALPTIYNTDNEIPVRIYNGDLKIRIKEIFDNIRNLQ